MIISDNLKLNKNTSSNNFEFICNKICEKYPLFSKENIKGIFLKELPDADIIKVNKGAGTNGKTSHIACTGDSRSFFSDFIATANLDKSDKFFYDYPTCLEYKFNIFIESKYITTNVISPFVKSHCALWILPKSDENQLGLSKEKYDDINFYTLRKLLYKDDLILIFKYLNENTKSLDYYLIILNDINEKQNIIDNIGKIKSKPRYAEVFNDNRDLYAETNKAEYTLSDPSFTSKYSDNIGTNKIFYGCPGVGKSYNIDKQFSCNLFRTTFHPEYTYYDFIGSVRPQTNYVGEKASTSYTFVPGDFTKALKFAIDNPNETVNFVIEELNRANTSSVFGDVFQLLDRDNLGFSKYYITNENISNIIYKNFNKDFIEKWLNVNIELNQVKIPNNLNIIASMNTSDQNINSLDSAFTRRWDTEYVPINFNLLENDPIIDGLDIPWSIFAQRVNRLILESNMINAEDKQIGPFFANPSIISNKVSFSNKVLVYLWKDVFKINRSLVFNTDIVKGIDSLITNYSNDPKSIFSYNFINMNDGLIYESI